MSASPSPPAVTAETKWYERFNFAQTILAVVVAVCTTWTTMQLRQAELNHRLGTVESYQKEKKGERDKQLDEMKADTRREIEIFREETKQNFQLVRDDQKHTQELLEKILSDRAKN